jgi:hypothetical protein
LFKKCDLKKNIFLLNANFSVFGIFKLFFSIL